MRLSTAPNWDYSNEMLDGLLYFTQRLDEMLFHYTNDIYKAPVLNTHLLLKEYLDISSNDDISSKYLSVVIDEFKCSINKDPIINKFWGRKNIEKTLDALKNLPENARTLMIQYLVHVWGDTKYFDWCLEFTKEIVNEPQKKEKIEQSLRCLLPELIYKGYSSEYIYNYNRKFLLQSKDPSIEIFLSRFDCIKRKYRVYIAAESWISTFKDLLQQRIGIDFDCDENCKKFKHDSKYIVVHIDNIDALDDNNAAYVAYERINLFLRFYSAVDNKEQPRFENTAMVLEENNPNPSFVPFAATEYSVIEGMEIEEASEFTETVITNLLNHARCSLHQLTKAIDLHNYSLRSPDYNGGFVNLWSVLEVLSLSEMGTNDLEQVVGTLLPILEMKFYSTLVNDFANKLKSALSTEIYSAMISEITDSVSEVEKIAEFLLLPKFDDLRIKYSTHMKKFPVLRYRMHMLSELAKEKRSLLTLGENYKQRVDWHLSRIYRVRNSITHSGEAPVNIRNLGEHLHYYVDILLLEVLTKLTSGIQFCTANNAIMDSLLASEILIKELKTKDELKEQDISTLLHPTFTNQGNFEYTCDCDHK